jgi:hypothetical protein
MKAISTAFFMFLSSICHCNVINYDETTQTYQVDKYGSFHIPKTKTSKLKIPEMKIVKMKIPEMKIGKNK